MFFFFAGMHEYATPSSQRLTATAWDEIDPALSPEGSRVAFASRENGSLALFEMDLARGVIRRLTSGEDPERGARYSPAGRHVAFARRRSSSWDIWVSELGTGREWRLTRHPGNDTGPAWSSDGRALYFASDRGRGIFMQAIYRLEIPGEI